MTTASHHPGIAPGTGPLDGVKVVELSGIGPCPMAGLLLARLGADVIRVGRTVPVAKPSWMADSRYELLYAHRPEVMLDLKSPDGRQALLELVDEADALIEGFRPGVCERLGVGPRECMERNARLVYGRVTGWGQDGPLALRAGHDINYLALTGALHAIGQHDGPPVPPLNLLADFAGGSMFLALGVVAALFEARSSGKGQVVDAAMVEGVHTLMTAFHGFMAGGMWTDARGSNQLDGGSPVYATYRTLDGGYMAVGSLEPQFYAELIDLLALDDAPPPGQHRQPEHAERLRELLVSAFAKRTRAEWTAHFEGSDACVTPVLTIAEAPAHSHNLGRGSFQQIGGIEQPRVAPRFSRSTSDTVPTADARDALTRWGFDSHRAGRYL